MNNTYSVALGLYVNAGVKDETEKNNGITHLLEHLHFQKLGDWEQTEIYNRMNNIGADLNGSTYKEMMRFSIKARPIYLFECLEFFERILSAYDWTEEHLQKEKQIVLNELYSKEQYTDIAQYVDNLVWENSPLSMPIIGNVNTIENITLEQIINYKKQYFNAKNLAIVITGNVSEEQIHTAANMLGKIKLNDFSTAAVNTKNTLISKASRKLKVQFIKCDWDYVDVNISFDIDNSNLAEASLTNSIIGGGIGSLLSNTIREELGLVYDIYSRVDIYNEKSVFNIVFSTLKKNIYRCLEEVVIVLNNAKKDIATESIAANINYFTENSWYLLESPETLNEEIGWKVFAGEKVSFSIEEQIKTYKKINRQALMDFAKNTFLSKNAAVVILGNTKNTTKKAVREIMIKLDNL